MPAVISLIQKQKSPNPKEAALKRLAIQIAAQLPEDGDEALAVLEYAETLVRSFLGESMPVESGSIEVDQPR